MTDTNNVDKTAFDGESEGQSFSDFAEKQYGVQVVQIRLVPERMLYSSIPVTSPRDVYSLLGEEMKLLDREMFCVVCTNTKGQPINMAYCSMGSINNTIVDPAVIFRHALLSNAAGVILAHNHPSSDCTPSMEDCNVTRRMIACGELMGIPILDHIIIGAYTGQYFSFQNQGLMTTGELTTYLENINNSQKRRSIASERTLAENPVSAAYGTRPSAETPEPPKRKPKKHRR